MEEVLASGTDPGALNTHGDVVISPLSAEAVPAERAALKAELTEGLHSRQRCRC